MAEQSIGICMLGCGVVGTGVARILHEERQLIDARTGLQLDIRHVIIRDPSKTRTHAHLPFHGDAERAIDDPQTKIVVELMGGTDAAAKYVERALRLGKPVVTANKSLLAARGTHLFSLARKHKTCIAFEASCAGGIPIIAALMHGLVANRIDALVGIVNGTCNFILTQMTRYGWAYQRALAEAQKLGFAEADPTMDVSGRDAAQKLAILATLAFNAQVNESDIYLEGIDTLNDSEIKFAEELGYVIKLLAIARRRGEKISLRVHPTLVKRDDVLADVSGSFNAISVYGHALGHALFYGRGAGRDAAGVFAVEDFSGSDRTGGGVAAGGIYQPVLSAADGSRRAGGFGAGDADYRRKRDQFVGDFAARSQRREDRAGGDHHAFGARRLGAGGVEGDR
jgi:homoserine dehydrogenase